MIGKTSSTKALLAHCASLRGTQWAARGRSRRGDAMVCPQREAIRRKPHEEKRLKRNRGRAEKFKSTKPLASQTGHEIANETPVQTDRICRCAGFGFGPSSPPDAPLPLGLRGALRRRRHLLFGWVFVRDDGRGRRRWRERPRRQRRRR